jgi:hypothetical protein
MAFKSKFSRASQGRPITASRTAMRPTAITGNPGSLSQAASQISASPMPFQNSRGPLSPAPPHTGFAAKQVHGRPSARGTQPGSNTTNAPTSAPMSDRAILNGAGYRKPVNYAGHAVHVQSNKSVRVMRGPIPGAKPLINDDDIFSADGIKQWNTSASRRWL